MGDYIRMKRVFVIICILITLANAAYALPKCVGSRSINWNYCVGTYAFTNGDKYVGDFKDGKEHGQGTYTWKNGNKLTGIWKYGYATGFGTYTKPNGHYYEGEWKNSKSHGHGTEVWENGTKVIGKYSENELIYGTYFYFNGDQYTGRIADLSPNGVGIFTQSNGDKYIGEFKDGTFNGHGTYYASGRIPNLGLYKDGLFVRYVTPNLYKKQNRELTVFKNDFIYKPIKTRLAIQSKLQILGLYNGTIDGVWGLKTERAVLNYATSKALTKEDPYNVYKRILKTHTASDLSGYSDLRLCSKARKTKNGKLVWATRGSDQKYVSEAKRRGLSCGVSTQTAFANITDNSICWSATYYSDGQTKWRERLELEYAKYVAEAWRRGLSCGVEKTQIAYDDATVCANAIVILNGKKIWGTSSWSQKYVSEAKRRHLSCGIKETQITKVVPTKTCNDDPSLCTTAQLCSKASGYSGGKKSWNTSYSVRKYVDEAKRFGLTCGVKAPTVIQKTCDNDPNLCNVAQLCKKASVSSGGKKVWRSAYSSRRYVTLAKDLGVSCGVKEIVKVEKPKIDKTYKVASGTGFYVSGTGHVITNDHVIDGCKNIKIQSKGSIVNTRLLGTDTKVDLALLKADFKPAQYFAISNTPTEELDDIIVAGYPFGDSVSSTIKFTKGVVSSLAGIGDDYSQIQIDAALQPGNSGGPIIDEITGNIVAVAVAKLDYEKIIEDFGAVPENTNFGIKASAVRNIMRGNNVPSKTPSTKQIRISELRSLAKEATVHLTCWMTRAQIEKILEKEKGKVLFKEFTD